MQALPLIHPGNAFLRFSFLPAGLIGNGTPDVPDAFLPYVDELFREANARWHDLQLEDYTLSVVFRELLFDRVTPMTSLRRA